jgi:hypothetical protein
MAICNCGCGQKVGFGRRGMNKNIQRTAELLTKLEQAQHDALRFKPYPDSDPEGMREYIDGLVDQGQQYLEFWIQVTHGGYRGTSSEAWEIKRAWNQWTRSSSTHAQILAAPPEKQRGFVEYVARRTA